MERVAKIAGAGPLADFSVGQRVMTPEGYAGTVDDVHEAPWDLVTIFVTLDDGMGGGEYAEAELQHLSQSTSSVQTQPPPSLSDTPTADLDYPELGSILRDRLPPQITQRVASKVVGAIVSEGLYLPLDPRGSGPSSGIGVPDSQVPGWREGYEHGKAGVTRNPSEPENSEFMLGYDLGWAEGVSCSREPANSWDIEDLGKNQTSDVPSSIPSPFSPTTGSVDLPMPTTREAGAISDWLAENGQPGSRYSVDWCRFRRNSHCWLPKGLNEAASQIAGYAVWIPMDRGYCWRSAWETQAQCSTGMPGPRANGFTDATVAWENGGQRNGEPSSWQGYANAYSENTKPGGTIAQKLAQVSAAFEFTASWADVRRKAKRIREAGGVRIVAAQDNVVVGHVKGDTGVYETEIVARPGTKTVASWSCGCRWSNYSWGRSGPWKHLEGRQCVVPETMISMADGTFKRIDQIGLGDLVVTHNGVGPVEQIIITDDYVGDLVEVKSSGYHAPLLITDNHEMWAYGTPQRLRKSWQDLNGQGFKFCDESFLTDEQPEWIDSGCLQSNDWVTSPVRSVTVGAPFDLSAELNLSGVAHEVDGGHVVTTYLRGKSQKVARHKSGTMPACIEASRALMEVVGLYLAEGNFNAKETEIQWNIHQDEEQTLGKVLQSALHELGAGDLRIYRRPEFTKGISLRLTNRPLAHLLYLLAGNGRRSKALHPWLMTLSPDFQQHLLYAYWLGDGSQSESRHVFDTSSDQLAQQVYDLLVRCGHLPSWTQCMNSGGPTNRKKKTTINRVAYVPDPRYTNGRRANGEGYYSAKVSSVSRVPYSGRVYNLKVTGDESYVANGRIVHNCSHAYALSMEVQARGMFGKTLELDEKQPAWMDGATLQRNSALHTAGPIDDKLRGQLRSAGSLEKASEIMLALARREEPKVVADLTQLAAQNHGELVGLEFRFKSGGSLLRKMKAEASLFLFNPGETAMNMSDTLRFTMLFSPEVYTKETKEVLAALSARGYKTRVKNFWARSDSYNGLNVALTTPSGHPCELQFHTEASFLTKEKKVHPIYEQWREETDPNVKGILGWKMRDLFDVVPQPDGVMSIGDIKKQKMFGPGDVNWKNKAASLSDGYRYLALHHIDDDPETPDEVYAVLRVTDASSEVWENGQWLDDPEFGRYSFLGDPTSEEISEEEATDLIAALDTARTAHHRPVHAQVDSEVPAHTMAGQMMAEGAKYATVREMLLSAGVDPAKVTSAKDSRFEGVTVDSDDDGVYVRTHRARSDSYESEDAIPDSVVKEIEATGSRHPFSREDWGKQGSARTAKRTNDVPHWWGIANDALIDEHHMADEFRREWLLHKGTRTGKTYRIISSWDRLVAAYVVLPDGSGEWIGQITWFGGKAVPGDNISGRIHKAMVEAPYRRDGVASAMLAHARATHPNDDIEHSSALTDDGKAWSQAVAGLSKTADEDQCPHCASDSLMADGVYTCEDGHVWHPDSPEARAFHDEDSPLFGHPLQQFGEFWPIPGLMVGRTAGARGDLPEGLTFKSGGYGDLPDEWPYQSYPGEDEIRAYVDGKAIGQIRWLAPGNPSVRVPVGYIFFAGVDPDFQRRGVATEMLRKAREIEPRVHHANHLTDMGAAWRQHSAAAEQKVEVSGVALVARDTGRVLMIQRALDEEDPASGMWEFPGGHHEPGDTTSLHAAIREWEEEVGQVFPEGGLVTHTWTSPNGIYQGHVVEIPSEDDLLLHEGRVVDNPDGDNFEQAAWWDPEDAKANPALREECIDSPWPEISGPTEREVAS